MSLSTLIPIIVVVMILFMGGLAFVMFWRFQKEMLEKERLLTAEQERFIELYRQARSATALIVSVLSEKGDPMNPGRRRVQVDLELPEADSKREVQVMWEVDDHYAKGFKAGDEVEVKANGEWVWPLIEGAKLFIG